MSQEIRFDWHRDQVRDVYDTPLLELILRAASVHRRHHDAAEIQVCKLISIKTGACPEDCAYCSQSARYQTGIKAEPLMNKAEVLDIAARAKASGASRVCLGAAWREVKDNRQFDQVLDIVRSVTDTGIEVCCTLGMLSEAQAKRLEEAGLYAYNHNLDTSEEYYSTVITTRTYADRLKTLDNVRKTGITVCCGGIIGMGESSDDRIALVATLARLNPHPESVPINVLSKVPGTPLENAGEVEPLEVVRMVATTRIVMPRAVVRLSAGRDRLSAAEQAMCFLAGANSIFSSDDGQMLTKAVASPNYDADARLLAAVGLKARRPFKDEAGGQRVGKPGAVEVDAAVV